MLGLVQVIRKVCDSRFSFKRVHGTTTVAVKIKFAFHFHSTVVPRYEMSHFAFTNSSVLT